MEQHAVVLIKPDAVRDVLDELILRDIQEGARVTVVFRKFWRVTEDLARLIYYAWVERPEFPAMVNNITQGNSLFVVVCGGDDLYESLTRVKGKMNRGGLRLKYRTRSIEEWEALGYSGQALQNKIAENRLHTTDDLDETVTLCNLALDHRDLAAIDLVAPSLVATVRRKKAIQIWTAP